ncbi:MAG: prepilin-type N-terminal cleavage/methylation domain-containing protein [Proteobacteria bacterium]|nr:prepilin-type N-terminal cleavage/methylation domain-containing protein [Pseudomonadota bacterium]
MSRLSKRVHVMRIKCPGQAGFTLVEVMLALAILAIALVGIMAETASNIRATQEAQMRGVVVDLVRSKMYDVEAELLKDGFQELDQSSEGDFSDEGWADISWRASVEKVELPALGALQNLQDGEGDGDQGQGDERGEASGLTGGPLGDLMGTFGGGLEDASFVTSQFELISQVLEAAIRKVTVTAKWTVGSEEQTMVAALYLTDPNAIDKVLQGFGRDEPDGDNPPPR